MRKVLKNTARTKKYLDKLPKIYGIFLWAKWAILELPWTGKYDKKTGLPLVYIYRDANGACDEYYIAPISHASSGRFWNWYGTKDEAKEIQNNLNERLRQTYEI